MHAVARRMGLQYGPYQPRSGVGQGWHACIGHERDSLAFLQLLQEFWRAFGFVELVATDQRFMDVVMRQQQAGAARVFGGDQIRLAQDAQGAQGDSSRLPIGVATTNSLPMAVDMARL